MCCLLIIRFWISSEVIVWTNFWISFSFGSITSFICLLSVLSAVSGVKVKINQLHDSKSSRLLFSCYMPCQYIASYSQSIQMLHDLSCRLCSYNLMCHFSWPFLHSASRDTKSCFLVCPSCCSMAFLYQRYWYIQHSPLEPENISRAFSSLHVEVS